jgi:cytochrome b6-f complex iron-sulfur subunit
MKSLLATLSVAVPEEDIGSTTQVTWRSGKCGQTNCTSSGSGFAWHFATAPTVFLPCQQLKRTGELGGLASMLLAGCGGSSPTSPSGGLGSALPIVNASGANGVVTLTIDTASPLASVGGVALVQASGGVFLIARTTQDSFTALTAICTHQMCTITNFSNQLFVCPCHGSEFDTAGQVARGPAGVPLHQYPTQFANNVLTITG